MARPVRAGADLAGGAESSPARTSAPKGGGGPSKVIGSMRLLMVPRRFMREVVSWPTKQPFLKSTPFKRS